MLLRTLSSHLCCLHWMKFLIVISNVLMPCYKCFKSVLKNAMKKQQWWKCNGLTSTRAESLNFIRNILRNRKKTVLVKCTTFLRTDWPSTSIVDVCFAWKLSWLGTLSYICCDEMITIFFHLINNDSAPRWTIYKVNVQNILESGY